MSLFEPDILNDVMAAGRGRYVAPAERRLMVAILTDALDCYRKNLASPRRRQRRICREAEDWILSDDNQWVFSFRNICDLLGLDSSALRQQTAAWKRHGSGDVAPTTPVAISA